MSSYKATLYGLVHWTATSDYQYAGSRNQLPTESHRRLVHATCNSALDRFFTGGLATRQNTEKMFEQTDRQDHGACAYWTTVRTCPHYPMYLSRLSMLQIMVATSPKLQFLLVLANQICNTHGRKLSVFCYWPLTQWNTELTLLLAGFNVFNIGPKRDYTTMVCEDTFKNSHFRDPSTNANNIIFLAIQIAFDHSSDFSSKLNPGIGAYPNIQTKDFKTERKPAQLLESTSVVFARAGAGTISQSRLLALQNDPLHRRRKGRQQTIRRPRHGVRHLSGI